MLTLYKPLQFFFSGEGGVPWSPPPPPNQSLLYVCIYMFTCHARIAKPNSSNLTVIRWKNERGELEKFRLHVKLVHKWRDIGALVVPRQLLEMWEREKDVSSCCRAVLSYWLDHPTRHYPATWEGLYELLDDIEFKQVAMDLKQAVDNAI